MIGIYVRVSTEEQVLHGNSLQSQIDACRIKSGTSECITYADEGISGEILERPSLSKLRDDVANGIIEKIVCYDPDRLSRKLMHQLLLDEEFKKQGVVLEFVNGDYANTPEGQLFFSMRGAIAEFEKSKIKERTMRGRLQKAKNGKVVKDDKNYGYRYNKERETLEINEEQAEVIRLIFHLFVVERMGMNGIANELTNKGILTATGKTKWHRNVIRQILYNRVYMGEKVQNKWNTVGGYVQKQSGGVGVQQIRDKEEWVITKVPAIITEEQFELAQQLLENTRRIHANKSRQQYLLSGLCRCAVCGNTMAGHYVNWWARKHRRYSCVKSNATAKNKGCGMGHSVLAHVIEDAVWTHLMELFNNPDDIQQYNEGNKQSNYIENELSRVHGEIEKIKKARSRLVQLIALGDDSVITEVTEQLNGLKERENILQKEYKRLTEKREEEKAQSVNVENIHSAISLYTNREEELDFDTKQKIVQMVIKEIIYYNKDEIEILIY